MKYNETVKKDLENKLVNGTRFHGYEIECLLGEIARLSRMQSEARWIPMSERLPKIGEFVNWSHPSFSRVREGYITESGELKVWGNGYCVLDNFKWQSLPTPPTEG
jgi:hypothetical protein